MSADLPVDFWEYFDGGPLLEKGTDCILFFGGFGQEDAGKPFRPDKEPKDKDAIPEFKLLREIYKIDPKTLGGNKLNIASFYGDLNFESAAQTGIHAIRKHFEPQGILILYGLSVGGINALSVARRVDSEMKFYGYSSKRLYAVSDEPELRRRQEPYGRVRIDLLITVDAGAGRKGIRGGQDVPPCVRRNLNFYQEPSPDLLDLAADTIQAVTGGRRKTWGGANVGDSNFTEIENVDMSGQADHGMMAKMTTDRVLGAIRDALHRQPIDFSSGSLGMARRGRDR
ncbi:MAG: hypothetical protein HY717_21775 [Planctomycetes bacterium]|nr:hypothetical protein [Planctomycetota bacterium]